MTLNLTSTDLAQLDVVTATLLSPLDYTDIKEWGSVVMRQLQPLLAFDQAFFGHALEGSVAVQGHGANTEVAAQAYAEHYCHVDPGMTEQRKLLSLEVYHRNDIYDPLTIRREEIYGDWCVPNKLFDPIGIAFEMGLVYP
ncbi:MAG: hypothetical protein ACREOJ_01550, partial [Gemmatimonadaceae bacterium]